MTTHHAGQRHRILERLLQGDEVRAVVLHRIGSGKEHGFVASLSRRISDIRSMGYSVTMRDEYHGQVRHTFYTLKPATLI